MNNFFCFITKDNLVTRMLLVSVLSLISFNCFAGIEMKEVVQVPLFLQEIVIISQKMDT